MYLSGAIFAAFQRCDYGPAQRVRGRCVGFDGADHYLRDRWRLGNRHHLRRAQLDQLRLGYAERGKDDEQYHPDRTMSVRRCDIGRVRVHRRRPRRAQLYNRRLQGRQ